MTPERKREVAHLREVAGSVADAAGSPAFGTYRGGLAEVDLRRLFGRYGLSRSLRLRQLALDLREHLATNELAHKLADALLEKAGPLLETVACGIADRLKATRLVQELGERLGRVTWKQLAIPAGVGALVGYLMLLLAPLLPGRTFAVSSASPLMLIIPGAGPDGSPVRFDPGSLLTMFAMVERPLDQSIPVKTLPGQRVALCDAGLGQEAINGNCWAW